MDLGRIVLLVFAALMLGGGIAGWRAARSRPSLLAGTASAVVLLGAFAISSSSPVAGFWLGAITSLALCVVFTLRWSKTGKLMPSGVLLALSFLALVTLTHAALRVQGKL